MKQSDKNTKLKKLGALLPQIYVSILRL